VDLLREATRQFERTVESVPPDAWGKPTPCDISVREVVGHVVAGNHFAVRLLAGASAAEATAGLDGDLLGDDPLVAVSISCEAQRSAFDAADENRALHHPSGDISLETFLRFRLGELVVHAWDLAVGAGLDTTLDPAVTAGLWALVEPNLDQMRAMGTYGEGATPDLAPNTPPQTRLLNAFGRHV
jgi:uncharacterized protein (TIGR03086 family)